MAKCIIFSRVSTDRQTLEEQTASIINRANYLGYSPVDQIIIQYKESAIKLSADERAGINKLKETIEDNPSVDCVIIWELSRIGRRADVIFDVRDFLIKHHIRWIVMKPEMEILGEGGKITPTTNLMLGVFTTFTENEMAVKQARFKRGKESNKDKGLYIGGPVIWGYMVVDKHYVLNPETAPIVKYVFDELARNGRTAYSIAKEFYETGRLGVMSMGQCRAKVKHIVGVKEYMGTRAYPQIVSNEIWEQAHKNMSSRFAGEKHCCLHTYYCQGIIYDENTGHMLTPQWADAIYSNKYRDEHGITSSISINIVDSLAFTVAHQHLARYGSVSKNQQIAEMKKRMVEINRKRNVANRRRAELQDKIEKIEMRFIAGKISEQLANRLENETENDIRELSRQITKYDDVLQDCINTINKYKQDIAQVTFSEIMDDSAKRNIVQTALKRIDVRRTAKSLYSVHFTFDDMSAQSFGVNSRTKVVVDETGKEFEYNLDIRITRSRKIRRQNHV